MRTSAPKASFFDKGHLHPFGAAVNRGGNSIPAAEHNEIVVFGIHEKFVAPISPLNIKNGGSTNRLPSLLPANLKGSNNVSCVWYFERLILAVNFICRALPNAQRIS